MHDKGLALQTDAELTEEKSLKIAGRLTAEEALAAAAAEGLALVRSSASATGFRGVSRNETVSKSRPYLAQLTRKKPQSLARTATAEEAALAVARALGPEACAAAAQAYAEQREKAANAATAAAAREAAGPEVCALAFAQNEMLRAGVSPELLSSAIPGIERRFDAELVMPVETVASWMYIARRTSIFYVTRSRQMGEPAMKEAGWGADPEKWARWFGEVQQAFARKGPPPTDEVVVVEGGPGGLRSIFKKEEAPPPDEIERMERALEPTVAAAAAARAKEEAEAKAAPKPSRKRKEPGEPKSAKSAGEIYMQEARAGAKAELSGLNSLGIDKALRQRWKQMPPEARQPYIEKAGEDKARYARELAVWKSGPAKKATTSSEAGPSASSEAGPSGT